MKRDEAIQKLRAARKELYEALVGIDDEDLLRSNAVAKWSLKDLLGHLAAWDEETLRVVQAFAMQAEPLYSYSISDRNDFAVWNQQEIERRQGLSLEQVRREFDNARRDLIQVVEGVTDQVLMRPKLTSWNQTRSGLELLEAQAEHDREHAQDVRSYRKKRERWARAREKYVSKRRSTKGKSEETETAQEE